MELITAPFNLANVYHSIHPAPASPVSGTWDTLLMLFLRATTSARLLALIQEMTAFTLTKAVPKAFIHHLSGAAYIKSGGKKGQASAYVQQLVESDRHRHYMAAEHAKGGGGGGSGGGGGGGGGGGSKSEDQKTSEGGGERRMNTSRSTAHQAGWYQNDYWRTKYQKF